jgi:hypothetical protein
MPTSEQRAWVTEVLGVKLSTDGGRPKPGAPNAGALSAELAALMRRIPEAAGADPAIKDLLMKLAAEANAGLKSPNLAQASELVAKFRGVLRDALDGLDVGIGQVTPAARPVGAPAAPGSRKSGDELLELLRDAKDEVDAGLEKLRTALLKTGDARMARIAKQGLYGMTEGGGGAVRLMKALFDLRGARNAGADEADALYEAARKAASAYKAVVFSDNVVDLVDHNPFSVHVGIRATLGAALETIENAA